MSVLYKITFKALRRTLDKGWSIDDALKRDERIDALSKADKKLVQKLVFAVALKKGEIDHFLSSFTEGIAHVLRIGTVEIKFAGKDPREVIDQLVLLAEHEKEAEFFRAILYRIDDREFKNDIHLNYPNWMKGAWNKAYGNKADAIMQAMMEQPKAVVSETFTSTRTGLLGLHPELRWQTTPETLNAAVKEQRRLFAETYEKLKEGEIFEYTNASLQYEEGEGFMRKLEPTKWQILEQKRVLPCDESQGNAIYTAKLKRL